ncbi:MAG: hypothetical protein ACREBB_00830 [Nitrosotalea sp.]
MTNIEKWGEEVNRIVYQRWSSYNWKSGFKIYFSSIYINPPLLILTLNPGGDGTNFRNEDLPKFEKGDFSVQSFHSYLKPRDPKNKMALAVRDLFGNDELLKNTVVIPILFFRSKNYDQWKKEFAKLNSEKIREEAEQLSYTMARKIIQKVKPKKILMVSFKTLDKVIENTIMMVELNNIEYGYYGKSKQRVFAVGKYGKIPVFCIRHLTGAIPKKQDMIKMKQEFLKFLKQ